MAKDKDEKATDKAKSDEKATDKAVEKVFAEKAAEKVVTTTATDKEKDMQQQNRRTIQEVIEEERERILNLMETHRDDEKALAQTHREEEIEALSEFPQMVLDAVSGAAVGDLLSATMLPVSPRNGETAKRARKATKAKQPRQHRSRDDIQTIADNIFKVVRSSKDGVSFGQIAEELKLDKAAVLRPLQILKDNKDIVQRGVKRGATYVLASK